MVKLEEVDAVVIGANIRGLVTAFLLNELGYRAVLLERGNQVGGADGSFQTEQGHVFDYGFHVLDHQRSELATRLFERVMDGQVLKTRLERAIVLRGQIIPYACHPREMPGEFQAMFSKSEIVDDIGCAPLTRDRIAQVYGGSFADLIFDEVLPSYPSEYRHAQFGVDEAELLTNIYPWFFPRALRKSGETDQSRAFHDRLRAGIPQDVLYPKKGGFAGFAQGFAKKLDPDRVELVTGAGDVHLEIQPQSHTVQWVSGAGRRFQARHYFWAGAWRALCAALQIPCQEAATDRVLLGSFVLDRPALTNFHEILVGDPSIDINRVHFPASFRRSSAPLMQVEFAVPEADERSGSSGEFWKERWIDGVRRLGLLEKEHRIASFDFKSFVMHFNGFGAEGEPLVDANPNVIQRGSNLHPIVPSMANLNLNNYVPRTVRYVTSVLAQ